MTINKYSNNFIMKYLKFLILYLLFVFVGCTHVPEFENNTITQEEINENVENIFGIQFPADQDWCTTVNGSVQLFANTATEKIVKAQILVSTINKSDSSLNMTILNEAQLSSGENISMVYDTPENYEYLFAAFITERGEYFYVPFKVENSEVYFDGKVKTRTLSQDYQLPPVPSGITSTVESWASKRGWLPGEVFYLYDSQAMNSNNYDDTFKTTFSNIIFSYFKNGRAYNNLPLIKKSGYYNESSYPITTGDEPIIISPVYKNDGGYKEIAFAELYYYYFKGDLSASEIEALPKYRVIDLSTVYTNGDNNNIRKNKSYALVYWGENGPSYQFPKGYKIGFMYKSNTEYEKPNKQGELYGDGRLNYNINFWGNFKSSKLEATAPRMGWINVNKKTFLCIESGTDADFNDLIVEVEGGYEPIIIPPPYEYNSYMFCFEDHRLGDYDMNDVVLKGVRLNDTQVQWTLMATGAYDDLFIYNVEGAHIKNSVEVHEIFGKEHGIYINTKKGDNVPYVTDVVSVPKTYSFLDASTQPYIFDQTMNWHVKISRVGQDPHAIMIPYDFRWPLEKIRISSAYKQFNSWGIGAVEDNDWYKYPELDKVY